MPAQIWNLSYLSETAGVMAGGKSRGVDYTGQEEAKIVLDWGKIAGLEDFSTHIDFVNRNGRNASADYVGDNLLHAQRIYGQGGDVVVHLAYADTGVPLPLINVGACRTERTGSYLLLQQMVKSTGSQPSE